MKAGEGFATRSRAFAASPLISASDKTAMLRRLQYAQLVSQARENASKKLQSFGFALDWLRRLPELS